MRLAIVLLPLFCIFFKSSSGQVFKYKEKIAHKGRPLNTYKEVNHFEVDFKGHLYFNVAPTQWVLLDSLQQFIKEEEYPLQAETDHYGNYYSVGNYYCGAYLGLRNFNDKQFYNSVNCDSSLIDASLTLWKDTLVITKTENSYTTFLYDLSIHQLDSVINTAPKSKLRNGTLYYYRNGNLNVFKLKSRSKKSIPIQGVKSFVLDISGNVWMNTVDSMIVLYDLLQDSLIKRKYNYPIKHIGVSTKKLYFIVDSLEYPSLGIINISPAGFFEDKVEWSSTFNTIVGRMKDKNIFYPSSFDIDEDNNIWIADGTYFSQKRIKKIDVKGNLLYGFPLKDNTTDDVTSYNNVFYKIVKIDNFIVKSYFTTIDSPDPVFSTFNLNGQLNTQWGQYGIIKPKCRLYRPTNTYECDFSLGIDSAHGKFKTIGGIEKTSDGRIYIADIENDRIQIANPLGKYIGEWGKYSATSKLNLSKPRSIAIDEKHNALYIPHGDKQITKTDLQGNFIDEWQHIHNWGVYRTFGITLDKDGNVIVAARDDGDGFPYYSVIVSIYNPKGQLINEEKLFFENNVINIQDLKMDKDNNLIVLDNSNSSMYVFSYDPYAPTSLESVAFDEIKSLNIYPQPASKFVYLNLRNYKNGIINYSISSIEGTLLYSSPTISLTNDILEIPLINYRSGCYFLKINANGENFQSKLILE